jgi:uncharacterized membrane protein YedE/YeeE
LVGGVVGGIIYSKLGSPLQKKVADGSALAKPTIHQHLGLSRQSAIIFYEAFALGLVALSDYFYPDDASLVVSAVVGGVFVGLSQALSLFLTGNTLGISGAFEQLGDVFWWLERSVLDSKNRSSVPTYQKTVAFAVGTGLGSLAVNRLVNIPPPATVAISPLRAIAGGAIMIYGSRLAGGCTSGHGISGMSQLSISSIITVAAMFGAGVVVTALL